MAPPFLSSKVLRAQSTGKCFFGAPGSKLQAVDQSLAKMDEMTQHNAALVEQAAAAAETLHEQAQKLAREVETFKIK